MYCFVCCSPPDSTNLSMFIRIAFSWHWLHSMDSMRWLCYQKYRKGNTDVHVNVIRLYLQFGQQVFCWFAKYIQVKFTIQGWLQLHFYERNKQWWQELEAFPQCQFFLNPSPKCERIEAFCCTKWSKVMIFSTFKMSFSLPIPKMLMLSLPLKKCRKLDFLTSHGKIS